ncbi:Polycystin-2 [Phytophthora citrophthora]|uniref:Polycystin-2 n=1 Tax=Phytophthora citrophthora TaxID=4793 RepID=A0AAD9LQH1_9STRA|nr:Polycystin-2 [Phytophthora citrophthora]
MIFGDRAEEFSSLENSMASCINMLFGEFDFDAIKDLQFSVAFFWIYMIVVSIVLMNMMLGIVLDAYGEVSKASYNKSSNRDLANHIASLTWDLICESQFYMSCRQGSHVSRGKIRPPLLVVALYKKIIDNPDASSTVLTLKTLESPFPDADLQLSESEFQASLKHIEQGISIVKAMNFKAGTMDSTQPVESTSPDSKV